MRSFQQYMEAIERWKDAVTKLWKTQRSVLIFGATGASLIIIACMLLASGVILSFDTPSLGITLIIIASLFGIIGFGLCVVAYIFQWIFYYDLKRWRDVAPAALSENIRVLAVCTLISLIATVGSCFFDSFSIIPYVGIVMSIFSSFISIVIFIAEITKFVMFIKLKSAEEMPHVARRGAAHIFYSYIVNFACAIIGGIFLVCSVVAFVIDEADNNFDWDDDCYEETYCYDEYEEYEYVFEYVDNDPADDNSRLSLLPGIIGSRLENLSEDDIEDFCDEITDSIVAVLLFIIGFGIAIAGLITRLILYYRGWWLISKSEFEPLPEQSITDEGEVVDHEEIECVNVTDNE